MSYKRLGSQMRLKLAFAILVMFGPFLVLWNTSFLVVNNNDVSYKQTLASEILKSNWVDMTKIMGTDKLPITLHSEYMIENKTLCASLGELLLVVIVHTAPQNLNHRYLIRETWMNPKYVSEYGNTRLLFLLGRTSDRSVQINIEREARLYGDILQGEFIDSYHNITNKAVMGYKWLSERCQKAKFILKVDDDVVVNIFNVFQYIIPHLYGKSRTVVCHKNERSRINRDEYSRWYVPPDYFPGRVTYPEYCWGFFVLLTGDTIPLLYDAAKSTPFFWVDDVYAFGLLMNRIPAIRRVGLNENAFTLGIRGTAKTSFPIPCLLPLLRARNYCKTIVAMANLSMDQMESYWKLILENFRGTLSTMLNTGVR